MKNKQILFRHFQETQHTYAMQIGNSRVWDYVGDNFVHRLVQSKGDGKLVAVEDQQSSEMDGKADSLSLEVNVRDITYVISRGLSERTHCDLCVRAIFISLRYHTDIIM